MSQIQKDRKNRVSGLKKRPPTKTVIEAREHFRRDLGGTFTLPFRGLRATRGFADRSLSGLAPFTWGRIGAAAKGALWPLWHVQGAGCTVTTAVFRPSGAGIT